MFIFKSEMPPRIKQTSRRPVRAEGIKRVWKSEEKAAILALPDLLGYDVIREIGLHALKGADDCDTVKHWCDVNGMR